MIFERSKILYLFLFTSISVFSQYTETVNSNRPGFSQGAFSVGKNILQFEAGFGIGNEEHLLLNKKTDAFIIDYNVRYGVWKEELEISLIGAYQSNSITLTDSGATFKERNFTSNTVGAKYLFFDPYRKKQLEKPNLYSWKANNGFKWKDLIPAISLYAGANFDQVDNPITHFPNNGITFFNPELETGLEISPTIAIATQNNWGRWVFVINLIGERITLDEKSYSFILTLTHAFTTKFTKLRVSKFHHFGALNRRSHRRSVPAAAETRPARIHREGPRPGNCGQSPSSDATRSHLRWSGRMHRSIQYPCDRVVRSFTIV